MNDNEWHQYDPEGCDLEHGNCRPGNIVIIDGVPVHRSFVDDAPEDLRRVIGAALAKAFDYRYVGCPGQCKSEDEHLRKGQL